MAPQPVNGKYIDARFNSLTEENTLLKNELEELKDKLKEMNSELVSLQFLVSENIVRREAVESELATVNSRLTIIESGLSSVGTTCASVVQEQKKLKSALEIQAQYSRLSTLLLSGKAVPEYDTREDTRAMILKIIKDFLGLSIHPLAVSACHRLRNKNVVLLRFVNRAEREAVYRQRIRPVRNGLLVHESLTAERLSVVKMLKAIHHPKESSPLQSHYTNQGKIFIKPKGAQRAIEVPIGSTRADIFNLCGIQELAAPTSKTLLGFEHVPVMPPANTNVKTVDTAPNVVPNQVTPQVISTGGRSCPREPAAHVDGGMSYGPVVGQSTGQLNQSAVILEPLRNEISAVAASAAVSNGNGNSSPQAGHLTGDTTKRAGSSLTSANTVGIGDLASGSCSLTTGTVPPCPLSEGASCHIDHHCSTDSDNAQSSAPPDAGCLTHSDTPHLAHPNNSSPDQPRSRSGRPLKVPPHKFSEQF